MIKKQAVIEVSGGVAEVGHASPGVEVRIIDWDNLEHLTQQQEDAYSRRELARQKRVAQQLEDQNEKYREALGWAIGVVKFARGSLNPAATRTTLRRLRALMKEHSDG